VPELDRVRRRLTAVLFGAVGLGTTGYIAALTVTGLATRAITGSATLAGVPAALAVVGTAAGTTILSATVPRHGRRPALGGGYALAAAGAAVAAAGVVVSSLTLVVVGMVVLGFGQSSTPMARYAASDMAPVGRRGVAVSLVVWAGTIGAVAGPALLEPAGRWVAELGRSEYVGAYLVTILTMGVASALYLVALRPDPLTLARGEPDSAGGADRLVDHRVTPLLRLPLVQVALTAMVAGQVVMVLIMTATPLHIEDTGRGLEVVGLVISAHTLGMFAVSPITGWIVDRIGPVRMIWAGAATLGGSALLSATAPPTATVWLTTGLFLLGVGWNMGFVAGSAALASGVPMAARPRLQGWVDSMVLLAGGLASALAGVLLQAAGYAAIGAVGLALLVVPVMIMALKGRRAAAALPA
jgi:MFS family permease